jgi:hypothetical protein
MIRLPECLGRDLRPVSVVLGKISDAEATRWIENLYGRSDVGEMNVSELPAPFNAE